MWIYKKCFLFEMQNAESASHCDNALSSTIKIFAKQIKMALAETLEIYMQGPGWSSDQMPEVSVGPNVRDGGRIKYPEWRADPSSGMAVGPKVRSGGRTEGPEWHSDQGPGWRSDARTGLAVRPQVRVAVGPKVHGGNPTHGLVCRTD